MILSINQLGASSRVPKHRLSSPLRGLFIRIFHPSIVMVLVWLNTPYRRHSYRFGCAVFCDWGAGRRPGSWD
ncbi:hypothetical protein BJX63DRAFT_387454 [Aspergillus granulosus]|uniref:Uncharacterized protein n=1 Tax=Aspergillus granulosus TaxID=176169 RepID=A0ABR4HLY5_9EURO